jgi:hypothetical protein
VRRGSIRKAFFSEEKNQKTLFVGSELADAPEPKEQSLFASFSSEKEAFL